MIYVLGAGFIGKRLATLWEQAGVSVQCLPSSDGDLRSSEQVATHLKGSGPDDVVVMTAAKTPRKGEENVYRYNVALARALAESLELRHQGLKQLVFLSSVDVYGRPEAKLNEKHPVLPITEYGQSKLASEAILQERCWQLGIPLAILRLPGVYGPNDEATSVIGQLIQNAQEGKRIVLKGDGSMQRDYLFVDDLQKVIDNLCESPRHTILNVATGNSLSLKEMAEAIRENVVADLCFEGDEKSESLTFDVSRFAAIFPDVELTTVRDGIRLLV